MLRDIEETFAALALASGAGAWSTAANPVG
jgi:hypothetical protein